MAQEEDQDLRTPEQIEDVAAGADRCAADVRKQAAELQKQADEWDRIAHEHRRLASAIRSGAKQPDAGEPASRKVAKNAVKRAAPKRGKR